MFRYGCFYGLLIGVLRHIVKSDFYSITGAIEVLVKASSLSSEISDSNGITQLIINQQGAVVYLIGA